MAKYKVKNTTILHNKKTYSEGSIIELKEEDAKRLEDFVELIPVQQASTQTKTTKTQTKKANVKEEESTVKDDSNKGVNDGE